jgi:hypothetical protein
MLRSLLVIGLVVAVGAAAVVNAVLGGESQEEAGSDGSNASALEGPDLPQPGALAGSLLFASDGCRLQVLDLAAVALGSTTLETGCSFWPSPTGGQAIVSVPGAPADQTHDIWLANLANGGELVRRLGTANGDAAWSPAGDRLAWCAEDGNTVVAAADGTRLGGVPGCRPRFTPEGRLLTALDEPGERQLLADGEVLLDEGQLRRPLPPAAGPIQALGFDQRADGLLAVVVAAAGEPVLWHVLPRGRLQPGPFGQGTYRVQNDGEDQSVVVLDVGNVPRVVLELWRGGVLAQSVSLRGLAYPFGNLRFGEVVRFSPGGRELAVGAQGVGVPLMLLDSGTLEPVLRPVVQDGFAWSPDGAWFALAGQGKIQVAGAVRSAPAYVLPIGATTLAWQ